MNKVKVYQKPRSKILREERQILKQKLWVIEVEKAIAHCSMDEKTRKMYDILWSFP